MLFRSVGYFKQASAFGLEMANRCLAAQRVYWRSFISVGGGEDGGRGAVQAILHQM